MKRRILLTKELQDKFINLPEHGMGYQNVMVYLKNGMSLYTQIFNSTHIEVEEPITMDNIHYVNLRT